MTAHVPTTIDAILDEAAAIRRSKGTDAMAQRAIEHVAASDRKQVERPRRAA